MVHRPLSQLVEVERGDIVCFVGAGGKTTLMGVLARELTEAGLKVCLTTTTRMTVQEAEELEIVHRGPTEGGEKVRGLDPAELPALAKAADVLLVEADGARDLPFKVPRAHEPVLPEGPCKVVVVMGLVALDRPVGEVCFHAPDTAPEAVLTPDLVRRLTFREDGYLKDRGPGRRFYLVLNGTDLVDECRAVELARGLYHRDVEAVVVGSALQKEFHRVDNSQDRVCGVVLAAGSGTRFDGKDKLLAKVDGREVILRVLDAALGAELDKVVVVVNDRAGEVGRFVSGYDIDLVENPEHALGMSTSLRAGLRAVEAKADAVMVFLGDQPLVSSALRDEILSAYRGSTAQICAPYHGDRRGHPVIIRKDLFAELHMLEGDIGAREVVARNGEWVKRVDMVDGDVLSDVDTVEELEELGRGR